MRKIGFALASLLIAALLQGQGGGLGVSAFARDRRHPDRDRRWRQRPLRAEHRGQGQDARGYRDQLVTERERQGDWVRVEIAGSDGAEGWIHASLLAVPSAEQLARAQRRATEPPRAGLPEAKPPAPAEAINPAPAEPAGASNPAPAEPAGASNPAPVEPAPPAPAAKPPAPAIKPPEPATPSPAPATPPPAPAAKPSASAHSTGAPATADAANGADTTTDSATGAPSLGEPGTKAPPAAEPSAVEPAGGPGEAADAADLARFRESVDYLNSRSTSVAGVDLFGGVQAVGDGVVQVAATDAWSTIPPGSQQSYANTLLDRWAAARGYSGPVKVQIVDPKGKVLLESQKP